jgi:hypothetical protein
MAGLANIAVAHVCADLYQGAARATEPGLGLGAAGQVGVRAAAVEYACLLFMKRIAMHWNGMEWNGMEWNGMEWNGMEWNGMEWNGMEYCKFGN